MKRLIRCLIIFGFIVVLLGMGGYTLSSFKHEAQIQDPSNILGPFIDSLPTGKLTEPIQGNDSNVDLNITGNDTQLDNPDIHIGENLPDFSADPGISNPGGPFGGGDTEITNPGNNIEVGNLDINNPGDQLNISDNDTELPGIDNKSTPNYVDSNGNIQKVDLHLPNNIELSYATSIKIKLDDKEITLTSKNTAEFVRWLHNNWSSSANLSYDVTKPEETTNSTNNTIGENTTSVEVSYDTILTSEDNLNNMISSIRVIDKLPELTTYDRNTFEKPTQSYTLNGNKVNRNDYSWKNSPWYNVEDNTYMCPYTGTIIEDLDDGKDDNDFGNLDYDHIVPLKSAYLRGASEWTDEQKNEYAYNQFVGVDVLNSANRSKSDKGPCSYLPDINVEDYCYSWLMICSKYDLAMTQEEIDLCKDYITIALENGEEVSFLGGSYEIN